MSAGECVQGRVNCGTDVSVDVDAEYVFVHHMNGMLYPGI